MTSVEVAMGPVLCETSSIERRTVLLHKAAETSACISISYASICASTSQRGTSSQKSPNRYSAPQEALRLTIVLQRAENALVRFELHAANPVRLDASRGLCGSAAGERTSASRPLRHGSAYGAQNGLSIIMLVIPSLC